jgi:hypothetical protein
MRLEDEALTLNKESKSDMEILNGGEGVTVGVSN